MRFISFVLVALMLFSTFPIQSLAAVTDTERQNEELLKGELRKAVDEKQYPNGMFDFLANRMNTSENLSSVEFAIVRKGGVAGKASVTFKAIDVSAKYGKDYTISVPKGLFTQTLSENADAKPLIESFKNVETSVSDGVYSVTDAVYSENIGTKYLELPALNRGVEVKNSGLREARDTFTGTESERKTWREVDQETKDSALALHNEMYEGVPGVIYTFNFEDGEYIKKIKFNTIDDTISEDEEQVMFALLDPIGGALGESVSGFMNIQDNEVKEKVEFEIVEDKISVDRLTGFAEVTVRRTAGLFRYGMIQVGTAALTAQPEVDYEPVSTEIRFVPGQETQKVRIPLLNVESGEELQFLIKLDPESPNLSAIGKVRSLVTIKAPIKYLMRQSSEASTLLTTTDALTATAKQVKVIIKAVEEDTDARVTPKTWTSATKSVDSPSEYVGSLNFFLEGNLTEKDFSIDDDNIYFVPRFADNSLDKSKVYLWGFKIERRGGLAGEPYYYLQSCSLDMHALSLNLLKDVKGKKIPFTEVLMNNNIVSVLPVYKVRNAFFVINNDQAKGDMEPHTFNSGEAIRVGMLDTVNIRVNAKDGYRISGYKHSNIGIESNYFFGDSGVSEYPFELMSYAEIGLDKQDLKGVYDYTIMWYKPYDNTYYDPRSEYYRPKFTPIEGLNINPAFPGELDLKPQKNLSILNVEYSPTALKVKVDPNSGDMDKGSVAFFPEEGNPKTGDKNNPMIISPIERNKTYTLSGSPDKGYRILWKDWSGDINEDGILDETESENMKKYEHLFDRKAVNGSFYNYVTNYDKPLIYYSFEPKPTNTVPGTITGKVYISGGTVLQNSATQAASTTKKPLPDVTVMVNGNTVSTDNDGKFLIKHSDFTTNEYHTIVVNYKGANYTGYVNVNAFTSITIEEYDSFIPYDFLAFQGKSMVDLKKIDNRDANFRFNFYAKAIKPGISAQKALIRIYSKERVQRGEPIEVPASNSAFTFDFNPAAYNVVAGDSMTIQFMDQNKVGYAEHEVGFIFKKYLSTFSLLNSFKSPVKPAVDLIGTVDAAFDLGLAGKADKYMEKSEKEWIIRFGFSDSWNKSLSDGSDVKDKKPADEALKDAAKAPEPGETEAKKEKEVTETADKAINKENKEKKSASVTSDMKFGLSTSLYLRMTVNDNPSSPEYGNAYFNEMILSVTVSGSYNKRIERMTPIGVTVYVDMVLGGEITAMLVIEQYQGKKFYFNNEGEIDFSKADRDDPYRNFTMYGKFILKPSINITAGAKIAGADLSITGDATFNLDFTSSGSSTGSVTLTSKIELKALFFTYKWEVFERSWSLYSKGVGSGNLLGDTNYLYGNAENYEVTPRDYLENRGIWQGNGANMLRGSLPLGMVAANEQILQTGVYPYPYTLLATIGENQQLLVFLDDAVAHDERNRTQLYYSIYDGSSWSIPQKVDNDNTPDGLPWISDMGDKVLVAWSSSASAIDSDDTVMEVLNNRNIKGRFFNKSSKAFDNVQDITHETVQDQYSDSEPYIAYWKDQTGKEDLMITYTKNEYKATGGVDDQDAVIGDVVNPYYSTLAYRFYNFNTNSWDVSADKGNGYYGQGFISVSDYVYADDSDFVITGDDTWNGYWSRKPYSNEIRIRSLPGSDPLIADSNLTAYKDYAVLAYVLDLDMNLGTTADRELFIQLYSYKDKVFYSPIRCSDNITGEYDLEFESVKDTVYLYYISDGDVMAMDIGKLIQEGLLKYEVDGKPVFVLNKLAGAYNKPETVVRHNYDIRTDELGNEIRENESPIDEFMVKADENNVYIVWGENDITYKDGIDPNSREATLPENHYREHHIYAARQTIGTETSLWSDPVKLTEGKGANYKDLDFEILPEGSLRTVFVKRFSEVADVAGKLMSVENINNSTLMTADYDVNIKKVKAEIGPIPMPKPYDSIPVKVSVQNMGLSALSGATLEVYQISGDTIEKINGYPLDLRGGEKRDISLLWQAPENIENTKLQAVIKDGDETLCDVEQTIIAKSVIDILDANTIFDGRNRLRITGTAVNNGNIGANAAEIIAEVSGVNIGTVEIGSLDVDETGGFRFYADIQPEMFENSVSEDGSVTEFIDITVHSESGTGTSLRTERFASKQDIDTINNISTFELKSKGVSIPTNMYLYSGSTIDIEPYLTYKDETLQTPRLVYFSDNVEIADFSQGYMRLLGKEVGMTTITVYALPQKNEIILSKNKFERVDNLITLSESAVKVRSFVVNVVSKSNSNHPVTVQVEPSKTEVATAGDTTTITTILRTVTDSSGKSAANVTTSQISSAVSMALEESEKLGQSGTSVVEIKVEAPVDAKSVETGIPVAALQEIVNSGIKALTISTPAGNMTFSNKSISTIMSQAVEDVKFNISKIDTSALSDDLRQKVGEHPVYDFSVTSGNRTISQFDGNVSVSMPYPPGENEDINAIVIYYINDNRELELVCNSLYNAITGRVTFDTNHFSQYAVGYNKVTFKDVSKDMWYADAVGFIAARGITSGTEVGNYSPKDELTRGQFMVMMMRTYSIKPDQNSGDNFADAGNAYYTDYLATAKRMGISNGTGNNNFTPDKSITRQEMFTLVYNTLKAIDKLPKGTTGKTLANFSDADQTAPWAKEAVTLLLKAGVINGSDGKLNLSEAFDRAQMAQVLYNLLSK